MIFLDKEGMQFLIPFATLLRGLCDDLLGIIPKDIKEGLENNGKLFSKIVRSDALSADKKKELLGVLRDYFDVVKTNIVKVTFFKFVLRKNA